MPRFKKRRCCRTFDEAKIFKPAGIPRKELSTVDIYLDEFEAIRLCDFEGKNQIEASEIMGVSRGTIQRLLQSGRKNMVDALLNTKIINIKNSYEDIKEKMED